MGIGICLLATAILAILVGIGLGISVAWLLPHYIPDNRDFIKSNPNNTRSMIREECGCLNAMELEIIYKTRPKEEVDKQRKWLATHPSIVAIMNKKYIDEVEDRMMEFACTGVILTDEYVLGGSQCFRAIAKCKTFVESKCLNLFRVRSHSGYWSVGGEMRMVSDYKFSSDGLVVIFTVFPKYTFGKGIKPITFPGKQKDMSIFAFAGWETYKDNVALRYNTTETETRQYTNNKACSKVSIKIAKKASQTKETGKPFLTYCNELTGLETEFGALDFRQQPYKSWIMTFNKGKAEDDCCKSDTIVYQYDETCTQVVKPTCG